MNDTDPFALFALPAWIDDALCAKVGTPEDWFPTLGHDRPEAVAVCNVCPVRLKCLSWALEIEVNPDGTPLGASSRAGIYGGLTPGQRATLAGRGEKRGAGDAA